MNGKELGAIIGLLFAVPSLIAVSILAVSTVAVSTGQMNLSDYSQQWGQTVVDLVTPWWVPLLEWGGGLGVIILVVVIVIFGKKALD